MKSKSWLGLLTLAIGWSLSPSAIANIVDFESINNSNAILTTPTDTQGLTFASGHYHIADTVTTSFGGAPAAVNYLAVDAPSLGFPVTVTLTGGGVFSILGLDASQLWADSAAAAASNFNNADFLHLVGNVNGGGVVTHDLALHFGFTSFTFSDLSNLDSMVISGFVTGGTSNASWAVDNINYAPVPEPETYAMLLAGLGLLGFMARRRKESEV